MTTETVTEHKVIQKEQGSDFYDWLRIAVPIMATFIVGMACGMCTAIIFVVD